MTTRERLVKMLAEAGYLDAQIHPATGYWRSSPYADVYRWEGNCARPGAPNLRVPIASWDTMTACVRRGFTVSKDVSSSYRSGSHFTGYEVWANQVSAASPRARRPNSRRSSTR